MSEFLATAAWLRLLVRRKPRLAFLLRPLRARQLELGLFPAVAR